MDMYNLFPKPVGKFDLGRKFTKKELSFLVEQAQRPNEGNTSSSDNFVLEHKEMKKLKEFLQKCVDDFLKLVVNPDMSKVGLRITQSWTNNTTNLQYHHKHAHPNSYLSGVLYVQTTSNDKITFHDEPYEQLRINPVEWNVYNSSSWWLPAEAGSLFLFKSSLTHSTPPRTDDQTRISLAFNTFPYGDLGHNMELTGLHLKA